MFKLEPALAEWRRQMAERNVIPCESLNELEAHLRDDVEHRVRSGLGAEAAFHAAVHQLGEGAALRVEFAKTACARRRTIIYRGIAFALAAFFAGAVVAYLILLPSALAASRSYAQWLGLSPGVWNSAQYAGFVHRLVLGMGFVFQIPVLILILVKLEVLDGRSLPRARKYVVVGNLVLAALLTTPEVVTQLVMFVPLQLLYELSVWLASRWARQSPQRLQA